MKRAEINRTFLARDVYRRWQSAVRGAETKITVFTPYFDNTLIRLLNSNETIEREKVTIVTEISPENALEMPYQLRAAKKALALRMSVLSLQGLHAKVLLIDEVRTCIGSQNFTGRGRKNKEASVLPAVMLGDSQFVKTLHEWRLQAREVTEDEIDELLKQLAPFFRKHKQMHDSIRTEVDQVMERQAKKREAALREKQNQRKTNILLRDHLQEIESRSQVRLAQRTIFTKLRARNDYETLAVWHSTSDDLTKLEATKTDGSVSQDILNRLAMYPIMFADSNRMAFARIGRGQITYIRNGVSWPNLEWVEGVFGKVSLTFPNTGTEIQNIVAKISNTDSGSCTFGVSFDGKSFQVNEVNFSKNHSALNSNYERFVSNVNKWLINSKHALDKFFKKILAPFRYSELGIGNRNANIYFENCWYKTSLIEVQGNSILVFKKH